MNFSLPNFRALNFDPLLCRLPPVTQLYKQHDACVSSKISSSTLTVSTTTVQFVVISCALLVIHALKLNVVEMSVDSVAVGFG
jgi:hypothetical protein